MPEEEPLIPDESNQEILDHEDVLGTEVVESSTEITVIQNKYRSRISEVILNIYNLISEKVIHVVNSILSMVEGVLINYHKGEALRIIKYSIVRGIEYAQNYFILDKEFALELIKKGHSVDVIMIQSYFTGLDKEVLLEIIKRIGNYRSDHILAHKAYNFSMFVGLDKEVALELFSKGYGFKVIENADKFEGLKLDLEFVNSVLERYPENAEIIGENLEKFCLEVLQEVKTKVAEINGLIVSDATKIEEFRNSKWYKIVLAYIYAKGNSSNYEKNLAMGDKTEHLERFKFLKSGYPFKVSGVLGYKLKEGVEEDLEILKIYQQRLSRIRGFVTSRGPNNQELQTDFNTKVGKLFQVEALEKFKEIENLSVKEKLICIILTNLLSGSRNVPEWLRDLVIEYKYVYLENLEDYIRASAVDVERQKDGVSQRRALWNELSNIYGENQKHVLQNELFKSLRENDHYDAIMQVIQEQVGEMNNVSVSTKEIDRFKNTFDNHNIPEVSYFDETKNKQVPSKIEVVRKQAIAVAKNNLKFDSSEEEVEFVSEFEAIMDDLKSNFRMQYVVETTLPELKKLNLMYRLKLVKQIDTMFAKDINIILAEIAKYQEIVEVEDKETVIGGKKLKKVEKQLKARKIVGHFTKNRESANARMGAHLCFAGETKMWANENYFECVLEDQETRQCVGLINFLNIEAADGKRYLWFGPNPNESLTSKVSSKALYEALKQIAINFAQENNYDGVVIPSSEGAILGGCTNRGGDFPDLIKASRLRTSNGEIKIVKFGSKHMLSESYGYEDGALIWEK